MLIVPQSITVSDFSTLLLLIDKRFIQKKIIYQRYLILVAGSPQVNELLLKMVYIHNGICHHSRGWDLGE